MCCISFFSGKAASMSSGSPPTQFYERRKKSRRDIDAGEGSSRNPPPGTSTKRTVHRDFPRCRMHIDPEIEEVEEDLTETSDDESPSDETYKMSPVPPSENSNEDDDESNDSGVKQEDENNEKEGMVEGTLNPQSRRRDPFHPGPTIHIPRMSLRYIMTSYKGKGATKKVKILQKVDPRSQQKDASDYRLQTHFQQDLYEIVIMDRRIVSEAQQADWHHMEEHQDSIYDQVIAACESSHLNILMSVHYDWNVEVIAQFYTTYT
jgi:hypothetical protein